MNLLQRIERAALRQLMRLPPAWIQRLAGPPIEIDGNQLDPHLQLGLRLEELAGRAELGRSSPAQSRRELASSAARVAGVPLRVGSVSDRDAGGIPVRIYRPPSPAAGAGPAVVFFHGGGGVAGSIDTHDEPCRLLCARLPATVISVEYRLAPEHPFPAAVEDALRAFAWVHAEAEALDIDPSRIAVAGDSFGGNLSAVIALAAGRGEVPACAAALLIYPWVDAALTSASIETFAEGFLLTRATMDWYRAHYLPDPAARSDPRASPLTALDLGGMPPTIIMTAGFDPLRDEGLAFADRIRECGGDVTYRCAGSMIHGFLNLSASLPAAGVFLDGAIDLLRARL